MRNKFETWSMNNAPAGRGWTGKVLPAAAAVTATVVIGLSVVMMAGLRPPAGQAVRYAEALPTVTVVGRRESGDKAGLATPTTTAAVPVRTASGNATVSISIAGDNLRQ